MESLTKAVFPAKGGEVGGCNGGGPPLASHGFFGEAFGGPRVQQKLMSRDGRMIGTDCQRTLPGAEDLLALFPRKIYMPGDSVGPVTFSFPGCWRSLI